MASFEDLLPRLQQANEAERALIVMSFNLSQHPSVIANAVDVASVLNWFNQKIITDIIGEQFSETDFKTLINLPYIEELSGRGWSVHENTRDLIRKKLWTENPKRYIEISRRAALWHRKHFSPDRSGRIESLFHAIVSRETNSTRQFRDYCIDLYNEQHFADIEFITRIILGTSFFITIDDEAVAWAYCFSSWVKIYYSRYIDAREEAMIALRMTKANDMLRAHSLKALGEAYLFLRDYPTSRNYFEKAIEIFAKDKMDINRANVLRLIGETYKQESIYKTAKIYYKDALSIFNKKNNLLGQANCIQSLGDVDLELGFWKESESKHESAIRIYQKIGDPLGEANCIFSLGDIHQSAFGLVKSFETLCVALDKYHRIGLLNSEAQCLLRLAQLYTNLRKPDFSKNCLEKALAIFESTSDEAGKVDSLRVSGSVYSDFGNFDLALNFLNTAIDLAANLPDKTTKANCYNTLGVIFLANQDHKKAESAFSLAIELDDNALYFANRAETWLWLGNMQNSESDLKISNEINDNLDYYFFNLGRLNLFQSKPDIALKCFDKAIEKTPANSEFHLFHALTLSLLNMEWNPGFYRALEKIPSISQIREFYCYSKKMSEIYSNSPCFDLDELMLSADKIISKNIDHSRLSPTYFPAQHS